MGLVAPPGHPTAACTCARTVKQVSLQAGAANTESVNWNWNCTRSCTSEVARVSRPLATIGQPLDLILEQSMDAFRMCLHPNCQQPESSRTGTYLPAASYRGLRCRTSRRAKLLVECSAHTH
jgi:hypothetical protein